MTEPLTLAQRLRVRWEATDEPTAKKINRMILQRKEAADRIEADAATIARLTDANKALTAQLVDERRFSAATHRDCNHHYERAEAAEAKLAKVEAERDEALARCTMWAGDFAQKCSEAGRLSVERDEARKMVRLTNDAIAEYIRYLDGGEMRGSYDGKPERNGLRKAHYAARSFLTSKEASHAE